MVHSVVDVTEEWFALIEVQVIPVSPNLSSPFEAEADGFSSTYLIDRIGQGRNNLSGSSIVVKPNRQSDDQKVVDVGCYDINTFSYEHVNRRFRPSFALGKVPLKRDGVGGV